MTGKSGLGPAEENKVPRGADGELIGSGGEIARGGKKSCSRTPPPIKSLGVVLAVCVLRSGCVEACNSFDFGT